MKKHLITAAIIFTGLLAVVTAILCNMTEKPPEVDFGSYTVAANEIEQLIANGDTETAQIRAAELKTVLSEYVPESSNNTAYIWAIFAVCSALIVIAFLYIWFAILQPFEKLTDFAERIANGDFDCGEDFTSSDLVFCSECGGIMRDIECCICEACFRDKMEED